MNKLQKIITSVDSFQQQHSFLAFPYAVIKKYGDDQGGYQSALLTYFGFLSLFPLLMVITTGLELFLGSSNSSLQAHVMNSLTSYFPLLGHQLTAHIHSLHKTGLALIVGLIFTFYGARGVAGVFLYGVNNFWQVPLAERSGFPKSLIKSIVIIVIGGLGLILASLSAGYALMFGTSLIFKIISLLINVTILFGLFILLMKISLVKPVTFKEIKAGAAASAIGLVILQSAGSFLLAHELKGLNSLYSSFALTLGLLFWIYLQAQVIYYAVEISVVDANHLWPRAIDASRPTEVDKKVYALKAIETKKIKNEKIITKFKN